MSFPISGETRTSSIYSLTVKSVSFSHANTQMSHDQSTSLTGFLELLTSRSPRSRRSSDRFNDARLGRVFLRNRSGAHGRPTEPPKRPPKWRREKRQKRLKRLRLEKVRIPDR